MDAEPSDEGRPTSLNVLVGAVGFAVVLIAVGIFLAVRALTHNHSGAAADTGGPAAPLIARSWTLTSYTGTDGAAHPAGPGGKLQFLSSTQLLATDTCKSLASAIYVSGGTISIGGVAATAAGCANSGEVSVIDSVLSGDLHWSLTGTALTLTKSGAGKLVYSGG